MFSIPGKINSTYSEGTNFLIKNHEAHLVTSAKDILKHMNWEEKTPQKSLFLDFSNFNGNEATIINELKKSKILNIDELCWHTKIPLNEIAHHLISLEFQGIIKLLPGKKV